MDSFDQLHRYLFGKAHVRGELVKLQQSYQDILNNSEYPPAIRQLLGELMAATSLLTATLKFEGEISVQLQSEGKVKYAVINGTHDQQLRGVARWEGELAENDFAGLFEKGLMVITITPKEGERYQGVVALDKPSLSECLEGYFEQSEQLPTRVKLFTRHQSEQAMAAGMLLQVLPVEQEKSRIDFEHLAQLTDTITADELFDLPVHDVLHRLYHQEEVEVFEPQAVTFNCGCSKERSAAALAGMDKQELLDMVKEQGDISLDCQFCNTSYRFDAIDIEAIHAGHFGESDTPQ